MRQAYDYWQDQPGYEIHPIATAADRSSTEGMIPRAPQMELLHSQECKYNEDSRESEPPAQTDHCFEGVQDQLQRRRLLIRFIKLYLPGAHTTGPTQ